MNKIATEKAPKAIGPYSQAIETHGLLFTAGQIGLDPATMKIVEGGIDAQAGRVFDNLEAVLAAAGLGFADVVKTTVYLTSMADFPAMNAIYAARFGEHRPARSTVGVAELPAGALVEIDVVARSR
ncbi:MAG TPA: RidA family protein [Thermoanaerobaculia bacterium]|nr:RidA family protein [Thermoanaerobaculia bacterium]